MSWLSVPVVFVLVSLAPCQPYLQADFLSLTSVSSFGITRVGARTDCHGQHGGDAPGGPDLPSAPLARGPQPVLGTGDRVAPACRPKPRPPRRPGAAHAGVRGRGCVLGGREVEGLAAAPGTVNGPFVC